VKDGSVPILDLLVAVGFCKSKSEARKKVEEGPRIMVRTARKPATFQANVPVSDGLVVPIGAEGRESENQLAGRASDGPAKVTSLARPANTISYSFFALSMAASVRSPLPFAVS
jgi:hypothetical protein